MTGLSLLLADVDTRTYYGLDSLEVWQWFLLGGIGMLVIAFIAVMYLIDSVELQRGTTLLLVALRVFAFAGLLLFFLNIEKRSEKKIVKHSRVAVLVDTSVSMTLKDSDATSHSDATKDSGPAHRIEKVIGELKNGALLPQLRERHDVVVYRFDEEAKPAEVASFEKLGSRPSEVETKNHRAERSEAALATARSIALFSGGLFLASVAIQGLFIVLRSGRATFPYSSWALLFGVLLLVASAATLAVANLSSSDTPLLVMLGVKDAGQPDPEEQAPASLPASEIQMPTDEIEMEWNEALQPRGEKTRLNDCLRYLVSKERGGSIAGIVVFSDGNNNDGISETVAAAAARDAEIPIYLVGLGSNRQPVNVRLADVQAPPRVYSGDNIAIKVLIQSYGMNGKTVNVRLTSRDEAADDNAPESPDSSDPESALPLVASIEDEVAVELGEDGKEIAYEFEVRPDFKGKRVFAVTLKAPPQDHDPSDNEKSVTVEVVEEENRVLMIAGGPTREFRFLRNQLFRDKDTTLDVYLQTGRPGITQESDNLLFGFPETAEELSLYDCIVAFDPDWRVLTKEQIDFLETWVAEQAGGLIVVAGPVYTPEWTRRPPGDERMDIIRALYPVTFFHQGATTIKLGRFGGEEPFPLEFTREGRAAEFLWLDDTSAKSEATWSQFEGVYGYYAVNRAKQGAQIFARFSDPETMSEDGLPIYFAGHFYGAGRVFFQASGEMWRVRAIDDTYFEQFYTKLIHWASQGRLIRGSSRDVLLVDKDRCLLGDPVEVRAILKNAQNEPFVAENVLAHIAPPNDAGSPQTLKLLPMRDTTRRGTYTAQFTALRQGRYRVSLPDRNKTSSREVEVRVPQMEIERSQRNDPVMKSIAKRTNGEYFESVERLYDEQTKKAKLPPQLTPNDQETYITGNPDHQFKKLLMGWLLTLIAGVLCVEWLIRRLSKLA